MAGTAEQVQEQDPVAAAAAAEGDVGEGKKVSGSPTGKPSSGMSAVEQMDILRKHPAYDLDNGDWASLCAMLMQELVGGYLDDAPLPEPVLGEGVTDGMEEYVRACQKISPAVSLELMLPAGYAYAGALGGSGVWVAWNGRGSWQVSPCTMQMIGLAPSGVGKSTQQKLLNLAYGPAATAHEEAVQAVVANWAHACDALVANALAADAAALTAAGPSAGDDQAEFTKAKKTVKRLISSIDMDVSTGVKLEYSDTTAEALVSSAINYGGGAFIKSAEQDVLDNLTRYSASGSGASLSMYTDGWDGTAYSRDRKGSGFEHTSSFCLSMCLMTQNESFIKSFATAGDGWLGKGLLGRAWLVRGVDVKLDEMLEADLARREAGVVKAPVPAGLAAGLEALALAGAPARAARMLEDRISRKARESGGEASDFLKKALKACRVGAGQAVTVESIAQNNGATAGMAGLVLQVHPDDAGRLEDLHAWMLRCYAVCGKEDPVLAPVVTRLTYHIAKLAGIRTVMLSGEQAGMVSGAVLEDTALRLVPWLLGLHLRCLGGMIRGLHMEGVRTELVSSHGRDTSTGGMIVEALKSMPGGVSFPIPVTAAVIAASRGRRGAREFRAGVREYFRQQYEEQVVLGLPGDGYFKLGPGTRKGDKAIHGFGDHTLVNATPVGAAGVNGMGAPGGPAMG